MTAGVYGKWILTGVATAVAGLFIWIELEPAPTSKFSEKALWWSFRHFPTTKHTPYAVLKDGPAGRDWLATIHGYFDNAETCENLVRPYNLDPKQSVIPGRYTCVAIR